MKMDDPKESKCPWCGAPFQRFWELLPEECTGSMGGHGGNYWKCGSSKAYYVTYWKHPGGFREGNELLTKQVDCQSDACKRIGKWSPLVD